MLTTLRIRNLVTIEDLTVAFGPGLNVLTGETGAGKSILVDGLALTAGERGDSALVRAGADRAIVEAAFRTAADSPGLDALLEARGLDRGDGDLVVRREVAAQGSGRVVVNGSPATVGVLRGIGDLLVDLHGQAESRGLLDAEAHTDLLDAFGGHAAERDAVAEAHAALLAAAAERERLDALGREGRRRAQELAAIAREIRGVHPRPGEVEALRRERAVLQNAAQVADLLGEAIARLDVGEPSAIGSVHAAERRAAELARIDPSLEGLAARLQGARLEIQDARDTLVAYRDGADFDPARLETIEERRAAIERLLLRWGPAEEDALATADEAEGELAALEDLDGAKAAADGALEAARETYRGAAAALSAARRRAAGALAPRVEAELGPLALPKASFGVAVSPARGPRLDGPDGPIVAGPAGSERAEFLLAANPGEPARPLARAASGGELSRVMLALHIVLDRSDRPRTLVFDEVDAGVSGAVALAVGARLAALAERHQVLCVTHLPQVAAWAARHYHVSKRVVSGRTVTEVVELGEDARVEELARMLSGRRAGSAARENAAELIAEARRAVAARGRR